MKPATHFKTLYGPVRSGRLGLSLGVDLLGRRICSLDCIYCEVGPTRIHTLQRRPYMPTRTILDELRAWKSQQLPRPEYITLGGLGEPCLNSELAQIIAGCRDIFPDIPVAVLTNSTLLPDPAVRRELAGAQVVLPSMDTLVQSEFIRINKPCKDVDLNSMVTGLLDFRKEYSRQIFLEILLTRGVNDSEKNLALLREFIPRLAPDRVDVVTMTRPGASPLAEAISDRTLSEWRSALCTAGPMSALSQVGQVNSERNAGMDLASGPVDGHQADLLHKTSEPLSDDAARDLILNSLRRRPQTVDQVRAALGLDGARTETLFADLFAQGLIRHAHELGEDFYQVAP
ncbi:radical SAM protein [Desulfonatronum thiosulfatophilum]|uniref:radical SAM protein n=1 Tax=Desulfonatronum thiosulfatophilum TaxID=617002 RepID=UPI001FC9AF57|nr:radical SAM protein [Desulfonatronum thiosulfatophilum]